MDSATTMSQNELDAFFAFQTDSIASDQPLHDGGDFAELSFDTPSAQDVTPNQDDAWLLESPFRDLSNYSTAVSSPLIPGTPITRPKLGSRFSREVIRTLKNWLAVHQQHPYPNDDAMTILQDRTGLNKAQLTNWFANARRRGKVHGVRPASPQVQNIPTNPMDIIPRPPTPAFRANSNYKDPLQRWVDSPPEHEPADAHDIARAMASTSRKSSQDGGVLLPGYAEPWQSPYARSSVSSAATSQSSGEFSAHRSSGSQSSLKIRRAPRRKRASRRRYLEQTPAIELLMPYQCTFCTEVFKTKYDWQRHEKSLHLPLEKWICALNGPRAVKKETTELCCVFCGEAAADDAHIEAHHYSACQERSLEERTFHRKDHLVQHLRLVHGVKFAQWPMAHWMLPMPDIKSRCGFCAVTMGTWEERTDHLADHFKSGATMANWHGDWGFDDATTNMVESAIPPYFVDYERSTLIPMKASDHPWGSPPNAFELLKVEIEFFIQNHFDKLGNLPTNDAMQLEACRIIFVAEAPASVLLSTSEVAHSPSWLRDLVMSSPEIAQQARFMPIRTVSESRQWPLRINGKDDVFQMCPLEAQLRAYVLGQQVLNAPLDDNRIQNEACAIVRRMEEESETPSDIIANWLVKGIYSSIGWLSSFKQRAGLPDTTSTIELPMDAITNPDWVTNLGQLSHASASQPMDDVLHQFMDANPLNEPSPISLSEEPAASVPTPPAVFDTYGRLRTLLPDDMNFYRIFDSDMKRWAAATMSPKNPNCHVPSDEEIQHQARWIMYDGDDTWNQTPADYDAWLRQFKAGAGIVADVPDSVNPAELTKLQYHEFREANQGFGEQIDKQMEIGNIHT